MSMPPLRRRSRVLRWQALAVAVVGIIVSQTLSVWLAHSIFSQMPIWWEIGLTGVLFLLIAAPILWGMTISPSLTEAQSVQAATELIISKVPEGIILIDAKGAIQHMNAAAESVFGGQLHQYQGRKLSDLIPALDFAFISSAADVNAQEFSGRKATGEDFPVAVSIVKNTGHDSRSSWVVVRDISEDKRRQHELVESSEQLHAIFSNMKIMLALMDDKFNFLRVNETYAAPSGHPPAYFIGKNHFDLYPDVENEKIFKEVVRSGEPFVVFAKPFAHPDIPGEVTYWDWSVHPIKDESGRVTEVLMAVIDATERQKLTDYQVLSEEKFRIVFDNVGDAVLLHDMFKNFIEVNAVACERLGYSKQELLKLAPKDISEAASPEQFAEATRTLMEKKHLLMETVHVAKDGRRIPVEINARLVQFDGKSAVLTVARDISARKRSEAARIASDQNMRALFNGAHDAVCLMKPDGTILEANQLFAKRLLTTSSELIGRNVFALIPSDVAVGRKKKIQEMLIRKEGMNFEDVRAGYIIDNSLYPILGENGEVDRIAVYSRDITQKRLDEQIEAMLHSIDSQILGGNLIEEILQYSCENISRLFGVSLSYTPLTPKPESSGVR